MKKTFSILLTLIMVLSLFITCGVGASAASEPVKVVTTIFPIYDWVREILGDNTQNVEVSLLLDNGVDLHSYQPTVEDIVQISTCDLFIYVGGESDEWVEDALEESLNPDLQVINLMEALGEQVKAEEIVEGMEADHDHDHDEEDHDEEDHDHDEEDHDEADHDHDHEDVEYDEHVWLSLRNAQALCRVIADKLTEIDPSNSEACQANAEAYIGELASLDQAYAETVESAPADTLLFGDRFPFRYMVDDYGLNYYAAFVGCSAETEASFETIIFLAGKVDELGLGSILQIESSDGSIARTISDNTQTKDQQILTLDSIQSVTAQDMKDGVTYLSVMEENLNVLRTALGG